MSQISIRYKGPLKGTLIPPSDKSISHRAIMISSLAEGISRVKNFLQAEDPMRTLDAFSKMGIRIESGIRGKESGSLSNEIIIHGRGLNGLSKPKDIIDCGNSGTTMRLLCGVLAGQPFSTELTGDSSLIRRPMKRVIDPLSRMGAVFESEQNGYPPIKIMGSRLEPITYNSPIASAQVKSAILLAGLYCDGLTTVIEPGKSRDHTERMLRAVGAEIYIKDLEVCIKGRPVLSPIDIVVPADLSSAAFFIVAGLIIPGSEIMITGTGINPTRTGLIDILKAMGADIRIEDEREVSGEPVADIYVKHSELKGIEIDGTMVLKAIDEFPVLCVAAAKAQGVTKITGAKELRVKESDRIASMASELKKMGVKVEELEEGLVINGREDLSPAVTQSYNDHRIAMSMIIAGFTVDEVTTIENTECVNTSFPGFMDMLEKLVR